MPKRSFFIEDSKLTRDQEYILEKRTGSSFIVKGCAGSGKSILALWKAKHIQNEGKGTFQFIVYTKALMQYMLDGISQVGIDSKNVNYHWYWKNKAGKPSSDYIIVDEAQDFTLEDILEFKSKANKALFLYGDSAQQIYEFIQNRKTISIEEIYYHTKFPLEQLVFNHRLPKRIARVAQYVNSEGDDLVNRCQNEGTENPKILEYLSFEKQLDMIADIINNRSFVDVGILFRHNETVKQAYHYLTKKGLNVEAKYDDKKDWTQNKMTLNFNSDNPKLMTYHSSKGLQFEAVFLPECSNENGDKNPLYVAITRTYQSLYIMNSGKKSDFFDAVPTNLYDSKITSNTDLL